jgi:hypothetical protein
MVISYTKWAFISTASAHQRATPPPSSISSLFTVGFHASTSHLRVGASSLPPLASPLSGLCTSTRHPCATHTLVRDSHALARASYAPGSVPFPRRAFHLCCCSLGVFIAFLVFFFFFLRMLGIQTLISII